MASNPSGHRLAQGQPHYKPHDLPEFVRSDRHPISKMVSTSIGAFDGSACMPTAERA
jgi:hypothetical protein